MKHTKLPLTENFKTLPWSNKDLTQERIWREGMNAIEELESAYAHFPALVEALKKAYQYCQICDHLEEVEIDGEMVDAYEFRRSLKAALDAAGVE